MLPLNPLPIHTHRTYTVKIGRKYQRVIFFHQIATHCYHQRGREIVIEMLYQEFTSARNAGPDGIPNSVPYDILSLLLVFFMRIK